MGALRFVGPAPIVGAGADEQRAEQYDALYAEYARLHDYFGRGGNQVMHRLKEIRRQAHLRARESTETSNGGNGAHL